MAWYNFFTTFWQGNPSFISGTTRSYPMTLDSVASMNAWLGHGAKVEGLEVGYR